MGLVTPVDPVPLDQLGRVHFIGIGGAGMSGIARIMLARGLAVSGSDSAPSALLDELAELGAQVYVGHAAANLSDLNSKDTLVISSAIRDDNPELSEGKKRGLRTLHRAAALASVMLGRRGIAIAGHARQDDHDIHARHHAAALRRRPRLRHWRHSRGTGLGAADGTGAEFIAEADESDGSFLMLAPEAAIITNVEADHLDNYAGLDEIKAAFTAFAGRIAPGGLLVTCADDPGARAIAAAARSLPIRVRTYGESADADYRVAGVTPHGMGISFEITATTTTFGQFKNIIELKVPGRHNALNAAAACAIAVEMNYDPERIVVALSAYRGARRRMDLKGEAGDIRVLDSYAHHPTELAADLAAARDIAGDGRVIAVFQPHLYSRTRIFAEGFGASLGLADEVIVLDIYAGPRGPGAGRDRQARRGRGTR